MRKLNGGEYSLRMTPEEIAKQRAEGMFNAVRSAAGDTSGWLSKEEWVKDFADWYLLAYRHGFADAKASHK